MEGVREVPHLSIVFGSHFSVTSGGIHDVKCPVESKKLGKHAYGMAE